MDNINELSSDVLQEERRKITGALMDTPEGRIFCGMLIEGSGFFTNSYINSSISPDSMPNAMHMCFNEGKKYMGEMVYSLLLGLGKEHEYPWVCLREHDKWVKDMVNLSIARQEIANQSSEELIY